MKVTLIAIFSIIMLWSNGILATTTTPQTKEKERGIYITQSTLENTKTITYLIKRAKAAGINTFVIDYEEPNKAYTRNIPLVKDAGLRYVVRIIVFPGGADREQMKSIPYREKKFNLIKDAIAMGADAVQLDYIRYSSKTIAPSEKNADDVLATIKWFHDKVATYKLPMQIDVFGITGFHPENRIGQYPKTFASNVDAINPMVYPSHFWPYQQYSAKPYQTVFDALTALKAQLSDQPPVKIHAFIEASNFHYLNMSGPAREKYVAAEIKAVEDANVDGWYFWSAHNLYDHVFNVLQSRQREAVSTTKSARVSLNFDSEINSYQV